MRIVHAIRDVIARKSLCATRRPLKGRLCFSGVGEMTTCVVYIDEAGDPNGHKVPIDPSCSPIFVLAGVAFPLNAWRERDRAFLRKKRHFFPDLLQKKDRDEYVEIKGNELAAPRNRDSARRHAFNKEMLRFIEQQGGAGFGVVFLKNPENPASKNAIYTCALQILIERISMYVAESEEFENAVLILDARMNGMGKNPKKNLDATVAKSHMSYVFGNETGKQFMNLMEPPMFADSSISSGIQIADIFAANLYSNFYQNNCSEIEGALDYSHMAKYWPQLEALQFRSKGRLDGYRIYGYRVVNHNKLAEEEAPPSAQNPAIAEAFATAKAAVKETE